jgi:mono/diheme cytochrome c family protein
MIKRQKITVGVFGLAVILSALVMTASGKDEVQPSDTTAYYNAKCVACHGKKAEKKFNATLTDEQMAEIVLKGKKAEKPPNMPGYEAKGVTPDQAKAFVAHMKQLHATP